MKILHTVSSLNLRPVITRKQIEICKLALSGGVL